MRWVLVQVTISIPSSLISTLLVVMPVLDQLPLLTLRQLTRRKLSHEQLVQCYTYCQHINNNNFIIIIQKYFVSYTLIQPTHACMCKMIGLIHLSVCRVKIVESTFIRLTKPNNNIHSGGRVTHFNCSTFTILQQFNYCCSKCLCIKFVSLYLG